MRSLLIALALAACSSPSPQQLANKPPPTSSSADPRAFALQLVEILERDDLEAWRALLSMRMQHRMDDDGELRRQLDIWRHELVPRAHELRASRYSLDTSGPQHFVIYQAEGKHPEALAKVVEERGALRLDEN
jgi:hypothetical protein